MKSNKNKTKNKKQRHPLKPLKKKIVFEMEKPEAKHQGRNRGRELMNRVLSACTASASAKAVLSQTEKDIRWVCEYGKRNRKF